MFFKKKYKSKLLINKVNFLKLILFVVFVISILQRVTEYLYYFDCSENTFSVNETHIINPHNYKYLINPTFEVCDDSSEILLIVGVLSAPNNSANRYAIRSTWSNKTQFPNMRVVFLIGKSTKELNNKIKLESDLYKDIVQEDFIDSYSNLVIKTIMGFKWAFLFCSRAKYYLKSDDDVIVNSFNLLEELDKMNRIITPYNENKIYCYLNVNTLVRRNESDKFYVPTEEYGKKCFEKYCDGPAYLTSIKLTKKLYDISLRMKKFRFEDVYVGILSKKLNVIFENWLCRYSNEEKNHGLLEIKDMKNIFFFYPCNQNSFSIIWSKVKKSGNATL